MKATQKFHEGDLVSVTVDSFFRGHKFSRPGFKSIRVGENVVFDAVIIRERIGEVYFGEDYYDIFVLGHGPEEAMSAKSFSFIAPGMTHLIEKWKQNPRALKRAACSHCGAPEYA